MPSKSENDYGNALIFKGIVFIKLVLAVKENIMQSTNTFKNTVILSLLAISPFTMIPAYAYTSPSSEVSIKIDQRDLQTPAGIERVYERLANKAESTCSDNGKRSLQSRALEKECTKVLLESFIVDLDNTTLTAYHTKQSVG